MRRRSTKTATAIRARTRTTTIPAIPPDDRPCLETPDPASEPTEFVADGFWTLDAPPDEPAPVTAAVPVAPVMPEAPEATETVCEGVEPRAERPPDG